MLKTIMLSLQDRLLLEAYKTDEEALADYVHASEMAHLSRQQIENLLYDYPNKEDVTVYRGLNFSSLADRQAFLATLKNKRLIAGSFSSWSPDKEEAEQFAKVRKTQDGMAFMYDKEALAAYTAYERTQDHISGYGVLLTTTIKRGEGIDVSAALRHNGGERESEIILPKGKYIVTHQLVDPFAKSIKLATADAILQGMTQLEFGERTKERYAFRNFAGRISKRSKDHVWMLFAKTWSRPEIFIQDFELSRWNRYRMENEVQEAELFDKFLTVKHTNWPLEWEHLKIFTVAQQGDYNDYLSKALDILSVRLRKEISAGVTVKLDPNLVALRNTFKDEFGELSLIANRPVADYYQKLTGMDATRDINDIKDPREKAKAMDSLADRLVSLLKMAGGK